MHGLADEVRPGDLITADFINGVRARLDELEHRVEALEAGADDGSVAIIQLIPSGASSAPIRVGQPLQIHGRNFGFSTGGHRVFFDSVPVTSFGPDSSDMLLAVTVPAALNVPPGGRSVTLMVTDGVTSDSRVITVLPVEQTLTGDVDVLWRSDVTPNPDPNPIPAPGSGSVTVLFAYRLRSRANLQANYTVTPTISVSAWQSSLRVLDSSATPIGDRLILLNPGQEVDFFIEATVGPPAVDGTPFSLTVVADADAVAGASTRTFEIGTPDEPSDPNITLAFTGAIPVDSVEDVYDAPSNTAHVAANNQLFMVINAQFAVAGTYDVTVDPLAGTAGWDAVLTSPATYNEPTAPVNETIQFFLRPQASGASQTGQIRLRVQRQGQAESESLTFNVALRT